MPVRIINGDITRIEADAIVNAANRTLLGGGGVDGCIHRAAGPGLLEECRGLGGCETGQAKITGGYGLPCRYVIHTVGPVYRDGKHGERGLLASCYRSSLGLAERYGCRSVAFPLISSGAYGYPRDEALDVAAGTIWEYLMGCGEEMDVSIVLYGSRSLPAGDEEGQERLREKAEEAFPWEDGDVAAAKGAMPFRGAARGGTEVCRDFIVTHAIMAGPGGAPAAASLEEEVGMRDESFAEMLMRKIDERGMTDPECYKKANITRQVFHKICSLKDYRPSKPTAVALAMALELPYGEFEEMVAKAGYSLTRSSVFDIIVSHFVRNGVYDIMKVNEALYEYDQALLGAF